MVDRPITVKLIRSAHNNISAEELESLSIINLNNQGINRIDNLELFYQIKELHLSRNFISIVENIEFLSNLEYLDISYNNITSYELLRCIHSLEIPKSLKIINLTGNSCANDDSMMIKLQDYSQNLNIIIGLEEENDDGDDINRENCSNNQDSEDSEDSEYDDVELDNQLFDKEHEILYSGVVNADNVLKAIVERKCRQQNLHVFDIDSAVKEINSESEQATKLASERRKLYELKSIERENQNKLLGLINESKYKENESKKDNEIFNVQDRINIMMENSRKHNIESSDFMTRLRITSKAARDEKFGSTPIIEDSI